jgi:transposase
LRQQKRKGANPKMRISFLSETVKELRHELKKAYDAGDIRKVRRVSVLLMIAERKSVSQIIETWQVSRQTIENWLKAFFYNGWDSLNNSRPQGRPARLSKTQKQELYELVSSGPEACGYTTGCWTSILIQDLIYKKYHVMYNRFYVCELLRNLGFSRQKARFISSFLDEEARKEWMETVWPKILAKAKEMGAPILFGDEASFAWWGSLSYTWAPKGQQPQIKTSGRRKGYKMFGAIEYFSGQLYHQGIEDKFNSASYQVFLEYLLKQIKGPIILIQDGARYHTSKDIRAFLEEHQDRLFVFRLPSYSPDYNPIEYLWKKVKIAATHNRYFDEFVKLINSVEETLATLGQHANEIKRLMGVYTKILASA